MSCSVKLLDSIQPLSQFHLSTAPSETLVVFDFDLTLSHLPIITTTRGTKARSVRAELRGGADTLAQLRQWHNAGARFLILTAKVDSVQGVLSVIQRLKQLGIDAFFDVQPNESGVRLESAAKLNRIRTAAVGDIIGSGHNKPEAFWLFAQSDPSISKRRHIVYVEDCADHVLNFEQAFRRVFRSDEGGRGEHQSNTVDRNHVTTTSTTSASIDNVQSTNHDGVGGETNAVVDIFAQVDRAQFEFQDATLLFWPPACEDGFETFERHSADAHERLLKRCSETTE